jgi:acyl carrier protein
MTVSEDFALAEIGRIVEREIGLKRDVLPGDRLVHDLGLDSMTLLTLAVALEDRFQVVLSDEEATRIETVGELARCITSRVNGAALEEAS